MTPRDKHAQKQTTFFLQLGVLILFMLLGFVAVLIADRNHGLSFFDVLLRSAVIIGVGWAVLMFLLYLERQPVILRCSCSHVISSEEPWVCYCGQEYPRKKVNDGIETKSFIDTKCERCGRTPQTLTCPICGDGVSIGEPVNESRSVWIRLLNFPHVEPEPEPTKIDLLRELEAELAQEELVNVKKLDVIRSSNRIDDHIKDRARRNRTPKQQVLDQFEEYLAKDLAFEEAYRLMLDRAEQTVDSAKRSHNIANVHDIARRIRESMGDIPFADE